MKHILSFIVIGLILMVNGNAIAGISNVDMSDVTCISNCTGFGSNNTSSNIYYVNSTSGNTLTNHTNTIYIYKYNNIVYAYNGTNGIIDYFGSFQYVMNMVLNKYSPDTATKIILTPDKYKISIPNNPPHNSAITISISNVIIMGHGSVIYNDGTGAGTGGTYFKQGNIALNNIEITGIIFDDSQSGGSTHQIIGFDYLVNNINIHDNRFINLNNAATIINTNSPPYAQNIVFKNNWMSKAPIHNSGDFVEIMGKNIWVTDNYFEELTAPSSAAFVPSFGKNMIISRNIINKVPDSAGGGIDLTPLDIMSGETWAYSNIIIDGNIVRYGTITVGGSGNGGSNGGKDIIIQNNEVYRGIIQASGGVNNIKISNNIASGNSWIAADGQIWGVNKQQKNIQIINNQISNSGNIGSILVLSQALSSNFIISGNIISDEMSSNSMNIINGNNQLKDIIITNNICTIGKPIIYSGIIDGGNINANNINC